MPAPVDPYTPDPAPPRRVQFGSFIESAAPCRLLDGWDWFPTHRVFRSTHGDSIFELTEEQYRSQVLEEPDGIHVMTYHSRHDNASFVTATLRDAYDRRHAVAPVGPVGMAGPVGPVGPAGHRPSILSGRNGPDPHSGNVGDYFIDSNTSMMWVKTGPSMWESSGAPLFGSGGGGSQMEPTNMSVSGAELLRPGSLEERNRAESAESMRRAEFEFNQRIGRGRIERANIEENDGRSLRQLMTANQWIRTLIWRWNTRNRMRMHFQPGMPARIIDAAPICWKGRSGVVVSHTKYHHMQDMVTFKLDAGVVGTRDWHTVVSVYDLEPMTYGEHTTEMQAWYARITGEEDRIDAANRGIAEEKAKVERERKERIEKPIKVEAVKHNARRRLIVD